jgi:hypothetical protein
MPSYRIYRLSPETGYRDPGEWVDAADDDEAIKLAGQLAGDCRREVWLKTRLVTILARGQDQH